METGKTLRGTARLAFDAVEGTVNIVEGMYRNIAATPMPFGDEPDGPAKGIAGFVHKSIRNVNGAVRDATELALAPLSEQIDKLIPVGEHREAAIAALNGICGDHLAATNNPLAIDMHFRQLTHEWVTVTFEKDGETHEADKLIVTPTTIDLEGEESGLKDCKKHVVLALHGLCMNDRHFYWQGENHALALAEKLDASLVYLRYNSGRHISLNGRELSEKIEQLVAQWPCEIETITLLGFSMGGLLARSAMAIANQEQRGWLGKVNRAFYVVSPHHGSVIERGGYWFQKSATFSPYTKPLSALGRIRSDGVTDLRHGNVLDEDWQEHDEHEDNSDHRQSAPLLPGIEHFAIASTLSKQPGQRIGKLLGDSLVHPSSATGRHDDPHKHLAFPEGHTKIFYGLSHLAMLGERRVSEQLVGWV